MEEPILYTCPNHQNTGGYESCCECGGWEANEVERECDESLSVD
jgi:hypothetical protein